MTSNFEFHCSQRLAQLVNKPRDADSFVKDTILGQIEKEEASTIAQRKEPSKAVCRSWCDASNECGGVSAYPDPEGNGWVCWFWPPPVNSKYYDFHEKPGWWSYLRSGTLTGCEKACNAEAPDGSLPSWCSRAVQNACVTNMNYPYCQQFCQRKDSNCDTTLSTYCNSIGLDKAVDTKICGCFLPSSVYETFFNDLSKYVSLPNVQAFCTYPRCASSYMLPYSVKTGQVRCPNIQQCIQITDIKNNGRISGGVTVIPSQDCINQGIVEKPAGGGGGGGGGDGGGDGGDNENNNKNKTILWIGVGLGTAFIVGLLAFFVIKKKK